MGASYHGIFGIYIYESTYNKLCLNNELNQNYIHGVLDHDYNRWNIVERLIIFVNFFENVIKESTFYDFYDACTDVRFNDMFNRSFTNYNNAMIELKNLHFKKMWYINLDIQKICIVAGLLGETPKNSVISN